MGRILILLGLIILIVGFILTLKDKIPFIGRLPGDFIFKKNNFTFYFPITTGLLISLVITVIIFLIRRFGKFFL